MQIRYFLGLLIVVGGLLLATVGQHMFDRNGFYLGAFMSFAGFILLSTGKRRNKAGRGISSHMNESDSARKRRNGNGGGNEDGGARNSPGKEDDDGNGGGDGD